MCFRSGHKISECTSTKTCFYYKERRNSAPCVKKEKGISTDLSAKENNSILLQTTAVRLTNKDNSKSVKVRVLFGSGSQESYVTQRIVDCLELQKITSESINVSVFGQSNSISKNINILSFCMSGVSENRKYLRKILINVYAVPLNWNPLKGQVCDTEGLYFEHLKGFKFGDCFKGGDEIDV